MHVLLARQSGRHSGKLPDLLKAQRARIKKLAAEEVDYVDNMDWDPFIAGEKPQILVVADNPGDTERENGVYLCAEGQAGGKARDFLDTIFGSASFERDVLALNKSSFHTTTTADLRRLIRSNDQKIPSILEDMRDNGRFVVRLVQKLHVPVLFIGVEHDDTFDAFREGFNAELKAVGPLMAVFRDQSFKPFHIIPHFSRSRAFLPTSDEVWNEKLEKFIVRWQSEIFLTKKGNISSKALLNSKNRKMLLDYFLSVMLSM